MSDAILDAINSDEPHTFDDFLRLIQDDRKDWPWHRKFRMWFRWNVAQPARRFPRDVRSFIQRGRRGWSDTDLWSMDTYLAEVNVGMLGRLIEVAHGYPPDLGDDDPDTGFEQWIFLLEGMKAGWEGYLKAINIETDYVESQALIAQHEAMMASYARWYSGLWD